MLLFLFVKETAGFEGLNLDYFNFVFGELALLPGHPSRLSHHSTALEPHGC